MSTRTDVKPLFRERDQRSMAFMFDLWDFDEVSEHADDILERVRDGSMPCDGDQIVPVLTSISILLRIMEPHSSVRGTDSNAETALSFFLATA